MSIILKICLSYCKTGLPPLVLRSVIFFLQFLTEWCGVMLYQHEVNYFEDSL